MTKSKETSDYAGDVLLGEVILRTVAMEGQSMEDSQG
jgi:hypothetical protein